ncbi:MAG: hypothetical protein JWM21_1234 [Acidobacteria bacterium]|nr:hypothetical protein [Acidobacteriota bacterium]
MKNPQRFTMAVVLALMLAASTSAGDIWIGKAPPPPPSSDMPITASAETQGAAPARDSVEGIALNLLQSILSVF